VLVFADIEDKDASQATAIAAATQQISVALGVSLAGGILEAMTYATGRPIDQSSFAIAFVVVGSVTALALIPFLSLRKDAGSSVSGHRLRGASDEPPPPPVL
jgi:hypothetical protein